LYMYSEKRTREAEINMCYIVDSDNIRGEKITASGRWPIHAVWLSVQVWWFLQRGRLSSVDKRLAS